VLDDGTGDDDHPHADIRLGEQFLYTVFEAVASGPGWAKTVLVITFDEWGGFFEHVAPPRATAANSIDTDIVAGKTLLGFRVPVVIASPFTLGGNPASPLINTMVFDHTSVLKLIEWRWGLAPLTPRDASSDINNLAYALNFNSPQTALPTFSKPSAPAVGAACLQNADGITGLTRPGTGTRAQLKSMAAGYGFKTE
jgi:phospholipase C